MDAEYDVVIVGGGAAGLSAAIYTTRAQLKTLVVEQLMPGGQILNTSDIENYPGFPEGVLGPAIGQAIHQQAENTGTEFAFDQVIALDVVGDTKVVIGEEREYTTKTIIIQMVTNVGAIGANDFILSAVPLRLEGLDGSPARVFAMVE